MSDRKNIERISFCLERVDLEEEKYHNPSKLFRKKFFVGENQKIHNIIFFDCGRVKDFREYSHRKREIIDYFYETTVSDPKGDEILSKFLNSIKRKYGVIQPQKFRDKRALNEKISLLAKSLINEVSIFFGGIGELSPEDLENKCRERIDSVRNEKQKNTMGLGELNGCGMCRHRSVLYKVVCDSIGIPCRIVRGWIQYKGRKGDHMWNEVIIGKQTQTVDCMNFADFVDPQRVERHFRNLRSTSQESDLLQRTIDLIKINYASKKGRVVGGGGFSIVYELKNVDVVSQVEPREVFEKRDLAVKEVNITSINLESGINCERYVRKEIDLMKTLRHSNVCEIIGSFSTTNDLEETCVNVVMKKYHYNALQFLQMLKRNLIFSDIRNEVTREDRITIEVLILLLEVAKGLLYIHSFGIVHYDIKLQNILLNFDREKNELTDVVVSDFGSSKEKDFNYMLTTLPQVTRKYAAPEILKMIDQKQTGLKFTNKSDVYSFGVVMSMFRSYYEGFPRVHHMETQCLLEEPSDRPSLWEVIYHLRANLTSLKLQIMKRTGMEVGGQSDDQMKIIEQLRERSKGLEIKIKEKREEVGGLKKKMSEIRGNEKLSKKELKRLTQRNRALETKIKEDRRNALLMKKKDEEKEEELKGMRERLRKMEEEIENVKKKRKSVVENIRRVTHSIDHEIDSSEMMSFSEENSEESEDENNPLENVNMNFPVEEEISDISDEEDVYSTKIRPRTDAKEDEEEEEDEFYNPMIKNLLAAMNVKSSVTKKKIKKSEPSALQIEATNFIRNVDLSKNMKKE